MTSPAVTSGHYSMQLPDALACVTRSARFKLVDLTRDQFAGIDVPGDGGAACLGVLRGTAGEFHAVHNDDDRCAVVRGCRERDGHQCQTVRLSRLRL